MASLAVVFMTVMIGSSSSNQPPVVTKETTIIETANALPVCRSLEASFHVSTTRLEGETRVSNEAYGGGGNVRRESTCKQINL